MPPKEKPSKKAVKDKQSKAIDDATFGLKNKNKSKKVQQFIDRVEKAVKFNPDAAKAKEAKEAKKIAKQLQEEEMRILFNEGISNQFGKKKIHAKSAADAMGIANTNEELAKLLEDISSDEESDDDNDDYNKHSSYNTNNDNQESLEVIEIFREKTIEDIIEEQREKLAAQGKVGTPVTAESFAKWRAEKLAKRQADAEARMKLEQSKKKGSKGLSVLSGKELFNYNSALFVDDDAAIDASEEHAYEEENKLQEEEEEKRIQAEVEAQQEQLRLAEIARLEDEENQRQDDEKRRLASLDDRETFTLGNVIINRIVFDMPELKDLEPFVMDEETDEEDDEDDDDCDDDDDDDNEEDNQEGEDDEDEDEEKNALKLESLTLEVSEHES